MIDAPLFARWIRVFGERIGKPLSTDTAAAYYATLSAELDSPQFDAAMHRIFRDHVYATWPSPRAIIESVTPTVQLEGRTAWTAIQNVMRLRPGNATEADVLSWIVRDAGQQAADTFQLIGGLRRWRLANDWKFDEMERDFLDASEEVARLGGNGRRVLAPAVRALLGDATP